MEDERPSERLTYRELGERLGVTAEVIRYRALRGKRPRRRGNGGRGRLSRLQADRRRRRIYHRIGESAQALESRSSTCNSSGRGCGAELLNRVMKKFGRPHRVVPDGFRAHSAAMCWTVRRH
jgi:hypothetical protein